MSPYIQPLKRSEEQELKVRVEVDVFAALEQYCEFLQSPKSYVVTEVLRKALRKDKAFNTWRAKQDGASQAPLSRSSEGKQ